MDTPVMSRSGRVVKKSAKLLEMESGASTPKSGRGTITLAKSMPGKGVSPVAAPVTPVQEPVISPPRPVDTATPTTPAGPTLKIKIPTEMKSFITAITPKQPEIPGKVIITSSKTPKTVFFKVKNEINDTPVTPKRDASAMEFTKPLITIISNNKKPKLEPDTNPTSEALIAPVSQSPQQQTVSKPAESPKKEAPLPVPKTETPSAETKPSPTILMDKGRDKIQKTFDSSASKINTIMSKNFPSIPRSIQDVRRMNQAARAQRQQQQQQQQQMMKATSSGPSMTEKVPREEKLEIGDEKKKKKASVSAYVLWCIENRSHVHSNYPELDFVNLSRKMGEIWHTLPQTEKSTWFKKAHSMAQSGATGMFGSGDFKYDDQDLKPELVCDRWTLPISANMEMNDTKRMTFLSDKEIMYDGMKHVIGTEMVDVQAYLSVLGDSLMTISSYMQRGIRYNSEIQYSPQAAISTLLDTALVALGTVTALTTVLPGVKVDKEKIEKTLDNVTLLMPPSELE